MILIYLTNINLITLSLFVKSHFFLGYASAPLLNCNFELWLLLYHFFVQFVYVFIFFFTIDSFSFFFLLKISFKSINFSLSPNSNQTAWLTYFFAQILNNHTNIASNSLLFFGIELFLKVNFLILKFNLFLKSIGIISPLTISLLMYLACNARF